MLPFEAVALVNVILPDDANTPDGNVVITSHEIYQDMHHGEGTIVTSIHLVVGHLTREVTTGTHQSR